MDGNRTATDGGELMSFDTNPRDDIPFDRESYEAWERETASHDIQLDVAGIRKCVAQLRALEPVGDITLPVYRGAVASVECHHCWLVVPESDLGGNRDE